MKVAICSDLHLEFGDLQLKNEQNADVLAKDIGRPDLDNFMESAKSSRIVDFFKRCSFQFPHVIYIMGNHEHYHGDVAQSSSIIRSMLESNALGNVHFLDKEFIDIDGVRFIGGTLWTDFNGENEQTMNHVTRRMNDFQICENSNEMVNYRTFENDKAKFHKRPATWSPRSALVEHKAMKKFIEDNYDPTKINVVCTHHAPSKGSEHPRYAHDTLMNGAYNSNLDDFIMERPMIKLWTHGHTHEDFDYMIQTTRVVCNPRGYINYEDRADRFELKVIEL
jgi:DNA repair exonuclease SbcCD nuclease subunit